MKLRTSLGNKRALSFSSLLYHPFGSFTVLFDPGFYNPREKNYILMNYEQVTGRRDRAKPLPFKLEDNGPWGFAGANTGNPKISAKFIAPCYYINK